MSRKWPKWHKIELFESEIMNQKHKNTWFSGQGSCIIHSNALLLTSFSFVEVGHFETF